MGRWFNRRSCKCKLLVCVWQLRKITQTNRLRYENDDGDRLGQVLRRADGRSEPARFEGAYPARTSTGTGPTAAFGIVKIIAIASRRPVEQSGSAGASSDADESLAVY